MSAVRRRSSATWLLLACFSFSFSAHAGIFGWCARLLSGLTSPSRGLSPLELAAFIETEAVDPANRDYAVRDRRFAAAMGFPSDPQVLNYVRKYFRDNSATGWADVLGPESNWTRLSELSTNSSTYVAGKTGYIFRRNTGLGALGMELRLLEVWQAKGFGARIEGVSVRKLKSGDYEYMLVTENLSVQNNPLGERIDSGGFFDKTAMIAKWPAETKKEIIAKTMGWLDLYHPDPHLNNVYLDLRLLPEGAPVPTGNNIFTLRRSDGRTEVLRVTLIDALLMRAPFFDRSKVISSLNRPAQEAYLKEKLGLD